MFHKKRFPELVLHEFPFIVKSKKWGKEIRYRIRIVYRIDTRDGLKKTQLDIRKHVIKETHFFLAEGLYFTREEFLQLYDVLTKLKNDTTYWRGPDGRELGNRGTSTSSNQTQDKLL